MGCKCTAVAVVIGPPVGTMRGAGRPPDHCGVDDRNGFRFGRAEGEMECEVVWP